MQNERRPTPLLGGRRRLTYRGRALLAGTLRAVSGRTGGVGSGTRLRVDHVTGFIIRPEDCRRGPSPHSLCALPRMLQKRTLASEDVTKSHWSAAHPSQARAIHGACRQIFAAPTHGAAQRHYVDVAPATPGTRSDVTKLHPPALRPALRKLSLGQATTLAYAPLTMSDTMALWPNG